MRLAEWLVSRPWLPGNTQHAVNVAVLKSLTALLEQVAQIRAAVERLESRP
jgi:hypothetical protein